MKCFIVSKCSSFKSIDIVKNVKFQKKYKILGQLFSWRVDTTDRVAECYELHSSGTLKRNYF